MSKNSTTAKAASSNANDYDFAVEPANRKLEMNIPAELANQMLAVAGAPFPDAADLDEIRITICSPSTEVELDDPFRW